MQHGGHSVSAWASQSLSIYSRSVTEDQTPANYTFCTTEFTSLYTKQVLFSEPPSCAWPGETQEPALETTVSSSHQPNGDHGDAAHHSQVFGRTPVTMTTRPLPFSLYIVIGKARACPDQSRWLSSGCTQITTSWTTTALASVELVSHIIIYICVISLFMFSPTRKQNICKGTIFLKIN